MMAAADKNTSWQTSNQLERAVARHVDERSTGTLFVRTSDNHWGCFVFEQGEIVSLMCRGVRGARSLRHLRNINECTYRFDGDALLGEDAGDLPSTAEILTQLRGGEDPGAVESGPIPLSATELKQTVCRAAVQFLGPVGELVCEEEFARAGMLAGIDDVDQLVRRVAREIDDPEESRQFREQVLAAVSQRGAATGPHEGLKEGSPEYNKLRDVIESEAAEALGPMGPVLCEDFFRRYSYGRNVVDVAQIIDALVEEVEDPEQGERFRQRVAARLR